MGRSESSPRRERSSLARGDAGGLPVTEVSGWIAVVFWGLRGLAVLFVVVTLLPLLRTGAWAVRGWEFPRLQLASMGAMILVGLLGVAAWQTQAQATDWPTDVTVLAVMLVLALVWQCSSVMRYTRLWRKQVRSLSCPADAAASGDAAGVFRLVTANLDMRNTCCREVAEALSAVDADVLLLIEIHDRWAEALAALRATYPHRVEAIADRGLGMALWSRLPVRDMEVRYLVSDDRASIHGQLRLGDRGWARFVGVHPVPPGLRSGRWYERYDSRIRDAELLKLAETVVEDPACPRLIAGDFNDVAWSQSTRRFERVSGLLDPRVGRVLLNTYHARWPLLRYPLDDMDVTPGFEVGRLERVVVPGSDHFGVLVELRLSDPHERAEPESRFGEEEAETIVREGEEDAAEDAGRGGG